MTVSGETPLVNVAETRNQLTLETESLSDLPMPGRSFIGLVTQAPGVSGLGTMGGGQPGGAGTPGSGVDNYSTETAVDASANGQGTVANKFIVDGLNVTSGIRQGVLNLTPNPDTIQETSIQVNTFTSEYGGGSSIQMISTTKSGSDGSTALVSDYYNNDSMFANTVFMGPNDEYNPFHSNNFSAAIGGPIVPKKQIFFFFAVEPLRSSASTGNQTMFFPDAEFASWARQDYPNTFGTKILNTYVPTSLANTAVSQRASDIFPTTCGTAATSNLPCSTAMIELRRLQLELVPRRRPVFPARRQVVRQRPHLRQLLPDAPELRRAERHPAVLDHQPQHAVRVSAELHARVLAHAR